MTKFVKYTKKKVLFLSALAWACTSQTIAPHSSILLSTDSILTPHAPLLKPNKHQNNLIIPIVAHSTHKNSLTARHKQHLNNNPHSPSSVVVMQVIIKIYYCVAVMMCMCVCVDCSSVVSSQKHIAIQVYVYCTTTTDECFSNMPIKSNNNNELNHQHHNK